MPLYKISLYLFFAYSIFCNCIKTNANTIDTVIDKGWRFETTPVWSDEFDKNGAPDSTKWSYETGGNGWGNHELEYYTADSNVTVNNGILTIEARKENVGGMKYSSAKLNTKNKGDFLYGRFEMQAKLPAGKGLWPAFWMLPTDWSYGGWPESGEVDIMEQVGFDPQNIHITIHDKAYNHLIGTQKTSVTNVPTATTDFHVYRVDWTPYAIRGFIDNVEAYIFVNEGKGFAFWPFDKRFYLLLNVAVGGDWGGQHGVDDNIFPSQMQVDYVRVYKMIEK